MRTSRPTGDGTAAAAAAGGRGRDFGLGDLVALVPMALHLQERTGSGLVVAAVFVALWVPRSPAAATA